MATTTTTGGGGGGGGGGGAPTILTLKQTFLTNQTRLLAQAPEPSRAWRRENRTADQALREKALNDALFRLNHTIQQHARRVYATQATRHVAEQIERLYLSYGERKLRLLHLANEESHRGGGGDGDGELEGDGDGDGDGEGEGEGEGDSWRMVGADYANPTIISAMPSTWEEEEEEVVEEEEERRRRRRQREKGTRAAAEGEAGKEEAASASLEAKRYAQLTAQLQRLANTKAETEARVQRLRRIKELLAPFNTTATATNNNNQNQNPNQQEEEEEEDQDIQMTGTRVQENLITRDGEIEKELERMRMLLVRVADKVARLREREGTTGTEEGDDELFGEGEAMVVDDVDVVERRKVLNLLDGMG